MWPQNCEKIFKYLGLMAPFFKICRKKENFQIILKNYGADAPVLKMCQEIFEKYFSKIWGLCPQFSNCRQKILEKIFQQFGSDARFKNVHQNSLKNFQ
jgi:hypothetical protein